MSFVDRAELFVKGGDGGSGCISFRREKYVPRGGPDGGDGGSGGSVIIRVIPGTNSLAELSFRRHWLAENGHHGQGKNRTGRNGRDLVVPVPPGTVVHDRDRGFLMKDLSEPGGEVVAARGGKGGKGNAAFATATNQAPRQCERGQPGEERWIVLELKLIADVGLIGHPNAGKSTLLSRLTKAHPKIADYPFTTKYPNLGICWLDTDRTCVLADIPGLIEGAHAGVGLGHEFLRHIERTKVLVHLIECVPSNGSRPIDNYRTVRRELELYRAELSQKPEIVVLSKCDLTDTAAIASELSSGLDCDVLGVSAVTGLGLGSLVRRIAQLLLQSASPQPVETR
jgi:GTP-binding protein